MQAVLHGGFTNCWFHRALALQCHTYGIQLILRQRHDKYVSQGQHWLSMQPALHGGFTNDFIELQFCSVRLMAFNQIQDADIMGSKSKARVVYHSCSVWGELGFMRKGWVLVENVVVSNHVLFSTLQLIWTIRPSWMQNLTHGWLCSPEVVGSCGPCNCHSWQEGQGNADFLLTSSVCHHMCLFDIHLASHFYCRTKSLNEFINKQTVNAGCYFNVKLEFSSTLGIETTNELIVIYISY